MLYLGAADQRIPLPPPVVVVMGVKSQIGLRGMEKISFVGHALVSARRFHNVSLHAPFGKFRRKALSGSRPVLIQAP